MVNHYIAIENTLSACSLAHFLGALGSWGAALLEPYSDKSDTKGILRIDGDTLHSLIKKFAQDVGGRFDGQT
jgi:hypothetical protein